MLGINLLAQLLSSSLISWQLIRICSAPSHPDILNQLLVCFYGH
ncbi:hypothetical protein EVA_17829 [gut metagenome]|uniref:Uncharacterized protein n=1 Tax=gut metagenome TaxID=749906 RepID=J9C2P1_9ZZZZ